MAAGGGGAWKVAFADFMTAMMALFLVLWISAQDKKILIATSKYFQSPFQSPMEDHSGIMPFNKESNNSSSPKENEDGASKSKNQDKQVELSYLNSVAADFYRMLQMDQTNEQKPIDIQVTSDGLRVTLFDRNKQPLFKDNGIEFTDWGIHLMQSMAWLIDRNHFKVTIDGHTREGLTLSHPDYTPWELSSDRANAARRSLVYYAVDPSQIERVAGYADTKPLPMESPKSESNQRITLSLSLGKNGMDKVKAPGVAKKDAPAKSKAPTEDPKFMLPSQTEAKPSAATDANGAQQPDRISAPENIKPVALTKNSP
jgi:chemotaxis protein MotB